MSLGARDRGRRALPRCICTVCGSGPPGLCACWSLGPERPPPCFPCALAACSAPASLTLSRDCHLFQEGLAHTTECEPHRPGMNRRCEPPPWPVWELLGGHQPTLSALSPQERARRAARETFSGPEIHTRSGLDFPGAKSY